VDGKMGCSRKGRRSCGLVAVREEEVEAAVKSHGIVCMKSYLQP